MERKAHRNETSTDTVVTVGSVRFGHDPFPVVAGPCAVESADQILEAARIVADGGAVMLRGGTVPSAGSAYAFQGLGRDGLRMLGEAGREVGLPVVTLIVEPRDLEAVAEHADMLEIGAGNMQNFELLKAVGTAEKPVLLKRGPSATLDEWLWAAEYILAEGNDQVVLCERGIRTFERSDTLDLSSVPAIKERSHLPVIVLPSHAAGERSRVLPLALAAQGVGANGVVVEVHPRPDQALSNPGQQLDADGFGLLMDALGVNRMRKAVDLVDRDIVRLLARRRELAMAIGRVKAARGMPVFIPEREVELLWVIRQEAKTQGLDPDYVEGLFMEILQASRDAQRRERRGLT